MANYKVVAAIVTFFVASCAGAAVEIDTKLSDIHNIDQCDPTTAAVKLLQTNLYEPAKFLIPVTRILNYPETGLNTNRISCLKITDMDTSNHGGYPEILYGGVGSYDVQIRFVSQWGQPLNFRIEIWAEKEVIGDEKN